MRASRWRTSRASAVRPLRGWVLGANTNLPRDISVAWVLPVPAHFHARYSAEARTYRYFIFNRSVRSALIEKRATHIHRPLDHERMQRGCARRSSGEHDFSAFRSSECQAKSTIRRLTRLTVERDGDWVVIEVTANAFLHHMVRNIVGVLIAIGRGEQARELGARGARVPGPHAGRRHGARRGPVLVERGLPGGVRAAGRRAAPL